MLNIDKPVVSPSKTSNILPINGSRNIILCFDGTTNHFGPEKITNVIRVFELLSKDANRQLCYYQAGIGSYDTKVPLDSQTSSVSSQISKTFDAAFANGIRKHILGGYKYLMANYKQGDVIYMFGFSRGAYTARVLCGMLDKVGLLISGNEEQVSFAWKMYRGVERKGHHRKGKKQDPELLATDFGRIYSQKVNVHFIGIWDTVRSAGLWRDPNLPEASDGFIRHFYHALALDERRAQFRPTLYSGNISIESPDLEKGKRPDSSPKPTTKTEVVELWFPGDHCDVGGRFTFDDRTAASLANPSFRWIVRSAAMLAKDPGLSFNFDAMLKYYDILFYNTPEKMVQVLPSETEWFRQDLVTFPIDEVWPTELDFLCGYGHHLLKHQPQETDHYFDDSGAFTKLASSPPQSSAVPMSARKTDIGIPINEMLKKHHGLNSWAILQVLTNHPLYGCPRIQLVQKSSKSGSRRSLKFNVKCAEKVAKRLGIASGYAHHIEDQSNYSKKGCIPKLSFDRQIYHMSVQEKHKLGVPPYTVKAWSEKNHQAIEVDIDNIKFIPARDKKLYDTTSQNSEPSQSTLAANMAPPQSQSTTIYTGENASWAISRLRELLWSMEHTEEEQTFLQSIKVLINLGVWYYIRFHSTNSTSDLDYAISCHHQGYTLLMRKNPGSQVAAQAALADSSIASDEEKLSASGKELELRKAETKLLLCFAWRKHNEDIELAIPLLLGAYRLIQIYSDDTFLRRIRELAGCPNDSREIFIGENLLPLDALGDLQSLILSNYAQALLKKYETHRSLSVLGEAVFSQERALASKKALTGKVSMRFSQQGLLYLQRAEYFLSSSPAQSTLDLYWAFVAVEKALRNMQDHFSSVTPRDEVLSQALDLCQTGVHVGEFSSYDEVSRRLEEAFAYVRQSLEMRLSQTGNWQPSWWFRDTLARLHYIHFRLSNSNTHIRQALDEQNKALQLMTPDQNERSISISRYRVLLVKGISILKPGEVDIAIQEQRDALRSLLTMDADRHSYLHDLGLLLCKRFLLRPIGPLDIDEAITVQSDAMRMMPENDSELMATRLYDMSNSYYARFSLLSQINEKSIDNAILNIELALDKTNIEENKRTWRSELVKRRLLRYTRLLQPGDLSKAIDDHTWVLTETKGAEDRALMKSLGKLLIRRFQYQGNLNDIEKAIDCYNKYLPFASGDEDKIECMTALKTANTMHKARLQSSNNLSNPERLRIIIEDLKTLCESNHQQSYKFIPQLRDLVDLHFIRFQLYDDITDLGEVITTLRKIVDLTELEESTTATVKAARQMVLLLASSYHFNLKKSQNTLGKGQDKVHGLNEHTRSGVCASDDLGTNSGVNITEFSEMDAIIKMCNASIKVIPDSSSAKPWFLSVIGRLYVERYGLTKDMRDFGIASSKLRSAVELASKSSRSKATTSGMLGGLYLNHFFNSNDFADLYRASSCLDDALKVTHDEQTFKPYFLNSFGIIKFQQSGMATADTVWIDGAIELFYEALALTPNNTAQKATYLLNLGTSIISRLRMVQGNKSVANAMSVFRHYFLTCIPDGHSEYTKLKYEFESIAESFDKVTVSTNPNLIDKLAKLFRSTSEVAKEVFQEGQVAQISERLANVLERVTRPETVTNISSNDRSTENLHLLGLVSLKRYKQRRNTLLMDWIDIDEAVTLLRDAARTSSNDPPKRSRILADLGEALNERFGDLGEQGDLDEAISAQEEAIRLIKDNNEQRLKISSDLGCSLVRYYGYYGNAELLNKGISLQEEAVKFASDYSLEPRRHKYLHNLSVSLICRIRKVKDLGKEPKLKDVERAIDLIRIAIRLVAADDTCVVEYKRDVQLCLLLKNQLTPKEVLDA